MRGAVALLFCAVLVAWHGGDVFAQERPRQQPPTRPPVQRPDPRQQVLQRLRSMTTTEGPDTTATDTIPADTLPRDTTIRLQPAGDTTGRVVTPPRVGAPDTVMQRLLRLPGFVPTEYAGTRAQFLADSGVLYVSGDSVYKATVTREGQTIVADSLLTYNRNTQVACGYGQPVLTGPQSEAPLASRLVCYNTESQVGMALGAQTEISEGANWIARGDLATRGTNVYMHDAAFTDCNLEVPHYHFAAGSMKVVNKEWLVARNVTLNFGDVPVLWLPFMVQSLKQGRRSGVLMPRFGINDIFRRSSRYNRRIEDIGFYWAINDYLGAEAAVDWYSDHYTALRGSFDYRWLNHFFGGGLTFRHFWETNGGRQFTLQTQNNWEPTERTRLNVTGGYASSSRFVRDNTFDPRELTRTIDSNAGVSHRFNWGTVNASATRKQFLGDNRVEMTLPQVSLTLNPVTLFPELTNPRWYNNITWNGNASTRFTSSDVPLSPNERDHNRINSTASSTLTIGNLSLGSNINLDRQNLHERELIIIEDDGVPVDTVEARPNEFVERVNWSANLGYQQRLIGTSTITPSISIGGQFVRSTVTDSTGTGGRRVAAPLRVSFNSSLKTDLFGFWPGIGPLERIRHRISPTFTYSYSPSTTADSIQQLVFGVTETKEQNRLTISLNQTIEGKLRRPQGEAGDSLAQDTLVADTLDPSRPRRMQQGNKVMILGLNTSAVVYDFVAARQGRGIQTMQLTNTITSDVVRGLQLTVIHDLFEERRAPTGEIIDDRRFSPHLRQLSTSFSLSSNSALFRKLGLAGGEDAPVESGTAPTPLPEEPEGGVPTDEGRPEYGLVGTRRREVVETPRGPVGSWNASFDLLLLRPRERDAISSSVSDGSMLRVNFNFQPTQNWNVYWTTSYSFSEGEFLDHILTFTRQLHDWDANFDFVKAQNGNFSFSFRVQLRANSDIRFEYEQRDNTRSSF